jgi:hypothetical protein
MFEYIDKNKDTDIMIEAVYFATRSLFMGSHNTLFSIQSIEIRHLAIRIIDEIQDEELQSITQLDIATRLTYIKKLGDILEETL